MKISGSWLDHPSTQEICALLEGAGFQVYVVGGCVRNALLGVGVADIDLSTNALPEQVMKLARAAGFSAIPTGIDHGTVTVVAEGLPHEITTFRRDVETDGRRAVVAFSDDVKDDARRRDFTMNALYARADGTVIDPLGGLPDLQARRVRFIEDPEQRIREDYLRALRFFRFHAWYGDPLAGLDADGLAAIAANVDGLDAVSKERIGAEFKRLLAAPDPALSVAAMRAANVLEHVLPGSDDRALAPLVHLENLTCIAPDPLRRLAVLGGTEISKSLRLSKSESRHLELLTNGIGAPTGNAELGYRFGARNAQDIALLRAAVMAQPWEDDIINQIARGAAAKFPVAPRDLMPAYQGPALGQRLAQLEQDWIASDFGLTRSQLLEQR